MEITSIGQIGQKTGDQRLTHNANELQREDFLSLLTAQLKYQNPLAPVDNFDFMSQTAQFNMLEQIIGLNEKFESLSSLSDYAYANNLIGRKVNVVDEEGYGFEGLVEKVEIIEGQPFLVIEEFSIPLSWVVSIEPEAKPVLETTEEQTESEV